MQQIGLDAVLNNVPDFTAGINKMNQGVDSFAQNSTKHGQAFAGGFGEIVTGALRQIGTLAVDALLKAGQAVTGFVKDSIGLAGDFESGMLEFQSVAGKDVDTKGLEQFRDLFIDIGKELPVSTSEVQQAAIEMVKGGIDPATIAAGGLKQNIQFAAAAMEGDLVKAAEISSKILGGWTSVTATGAEKSDFLTHATDLLAKAANASSTDVEGLSRGIFQSQGIAKAAGVEFDDLVTTLAELAPRFGSSAEAGTSLKNLIARLQPTTANATAAMKDLGLMTEDGKNKFFDATGSFIGFQAASELLQNSTAGLTDKQKALELQMIFGNDAMSAASALAELGAEGYDAMAAALENANGVQAAAALKQQGFNTALDNAKGSVEALQITIGSALLPILTDMLNNVIAPAVNTFTDWASAMMSTNDPVDLLISTLKDFSPLLADIVVIIGSAAVTASDFIQALQNTNDPVDLLISALKDFSPLLADIVVIIGSAVVAFQKWMNSGNSLGSAIEDLNGIWQKALQVVEDVANGYMAIAKAVLPIVSGFIDEHGDEISAFFQTTWDTIIDIVTLALELYDSIVPPILNTIAGFIEDHGSKIMKVLSGAWDIITSIITGALETIKGILKTTLAVINGDWEGAWKGIQDIANAQITAIQGVIGGFLDMIAGLFDTSLADILQTWEDNWNMAVDIVNSIDWEQVGQYIVSGIISGINSLASSLYSTLRDLASRALNAALDAIGAGSPAKEFMPVGQFAVQGIMQGFTDTWPQLTDQVGGLADGLVNAMGDIGSQMQNAIADGFGATASMDRQIAKNLESVSKIPEGFYRTATENALRNAQDIASTYADPEIGAKFFKMRSDQILEFQELQQKINKETNAETKSRLQAQQILILKAQEAEQAAFDATSKRDASPLLDIANQINEVMKVLAGINLTDEQIHIVDQLSAIWSALQSPVSTAPPPYNPGTTTNTNTTNLSMPIYTNMSPTAIQSSMAIAGAALL